MGKHQTDRQGGSAVSTGCDPPARAAPDGDAQENAAKPKKKRKRMHPGVRFLIKLGIIAALCAAVFTFVLGVHICRGNGMHPFIMDGDLLISYKLEPYRVGDPVLYRDPVTGKKAISRIAAIGACEINITEAGQFLIDGYVPNENVFYLTKPLEGSEIEFPRTLEAGEYFILDDFRTRGHDSRIFGALGEEDILGKVVFVFRRRGI